MHDATTVERLSKIISDSRREERPEKEKRPPFRKPSIRINLRLEEGYFSLFLVMTVVYSTIWSVQAAAWVENLGILTLTTALGLLCGVIAAKQRRLARLPTHAIAIVLGLFIAFWQTAGADFNGSIPHFVEAIRAWIGVALAGGTSSDDSIFLFFITALGFLLAYTSAWLVYRTRSPWLMILANAVVLLINLNNVPVGYLIFLVVFLLASMLLLLRFNLFESTQRWRRLGLRCSDDLGWDFMQAGLIISIVILVLSWLLPYGYTNDYAAQIWSANNNPWVQIQNTWNRLIALNGGQIPSNHGNFADALVLGGNPNLNNDVVFTVDSSEGAQYLASSTFDQYDGHGWNYGPTYTTPQNANQPIPNEGSPIHLVTQHITVVNPPGEQRPYLFGASQIGQTDQQTSLLINKDTGSVVAVLRGHKLSSGDRYTVLSYSSSADIKTLQSVPLPKDSQPLPPNYSGQVPQNYYDPAILRAYLQLPGNLDPNIMTVTRQVTSKAHNMYDMAVALESYFRNNYQYSLDVHLPQGDEGTSWLLFRSGHRGFCNYFATAMTVMARELGMPARVVVGYAPGTFDSKLHQWVVRGVDAHAWVQIYFAGYGWINFEPSPGFSTFDRPLPNSNSSVDSQNPNGPNQNNTAANRARNRLNPADLGDTGSAPTEQDTLNWTQPVEYSLGSLLLLLACLLALFAIWWRRLFRNLRFSAQVYGRICLLANWAGIGARRSETPNEYIHKLSLATPEQAASLERFGDIYVRELWAPPESEAHPARSGEVKELPALWKQLQPRLFLYMLRHPYFLRVVPQRIAGFLGHYLSWLWKREREPEIAPLDEGEHTPAGEITKVDL